MSDFFYILFLIVGKIAFSILITVVVFLILGVLSLERLPEKQKKDEPSQGE